MTRPAGPIAALIVACLLLVGCGGADDPAADAQTTPESTAVEESPSPSDAAEPESPAASPSTEPAGPVAEFDVTALCPADMALAEKVTGAPLTTNKVFAAGEPINGAPAQGDTCVFEGPRGAIEASVITEPALVERRKGLDFATIAPCETAPLDGGWDKAWTCDLTAGHGPILLRLGTDSVFTCLAASQGPKPQAAANGRAVCDAVLAGVGG